ncbi:hypothetical protein AO242_01140 [Pseudomonas sp. ICMP 561]|nr:hypothetical protein AO242_01140 [Pseudomonas sp. ICMP 561]
MLLVLYRRFKTHDVRNHADDHNAAAVCLYVSGDLKARQYGFFPQPELEFLNLIAVRRALDQLEDAVTTSALSDSDIDDVSLNVVKSQVAKPSSMIIERAPSSLLTR